MADDVDDVNVNPISDNLDLQGDDSGNAGASTGLDPMVDSTDSKLVSNSNSSLPGGDSGKVGATTGTAGGGCQLNSGCE